MNIDHALQARLDACDLDQPGATLSFTRRLARENGWDMPRARRVVREYKRFAYLALTAGHRACPPEDVDQAWHLHLTYTLHYWKTFCGEVLRQPLHHQPTTGGPAEAEKFRSLYQQTLGSYRQHFGEEPPPDIWPDVESRFRNGGSFRRVNTAENWVIPRPRWLPLSATPVLALLAVGCGGPLAAISIFDLKGRDFLEFFLVFAPVMLALAGLWHWGVRWPGRQPRAPELPEDPYALAFLGGGPGTVLAAALAALALRKEIRLSEGPRTRANVLGPVAEGAHPVEKAVHAAISMTPNRVVRELRPKLRPVYESLASPLFRQELLLSRSRALVARGGALVLALGVVAVGVTKIILGVSRDRPVGYLILLTLVAGGVAVWLQFMPTRRSRLGDRVIRLLRQRHEAWRTAPPVAASSQLPAAVGLYGLGILDHTELHGTRRHLDNSVGGNALARNTAGSTGCAACGGGGGGGGSGGGGDGGGSGCGGCGGGGD